MRLSIYITTIVLFFFNVVGANAQNDFVAEAFENYNSALYEKARIDIDSAILTDLRFESQTWQLRGLIYKKIAESDITELPTAVESFLHARSLSQDEKIDHYLKKTLLLYYNFAAVKIEKLELKKSEEGYEKYKSEYLKHIDQNKKFDSSDVKYYLALGEAYLLKAGSVSGSEKLEFTKNAISLFQKVLKVHPSHFDANLEMGVAYYNLGVDAVIEMTVAADPVSIEMVIEGAEKSVEYFNLALPYLKVAYNQNQKDSEVLEGLAGIHLGLNNTKEFDFFYKKHLEISKKGE